jgi:hypothetical protein
MLAAQPAEQKVQCRSSTASLRSAHHDVAVHADAALRRGIIDTGISPADGAVTEGGTCVGMIGPLGWHGWRCACCLRMSARDGPLTDL